MTLEEAKQIICKEADIEEYLLEGYNPLRVFSKARSIINKRLEAKLKTSGSTREQFTDWFYQHQGTDTPETTAYKNAMRALNKVEETMGIYDQEYCTTKHL